MRFLFLLFSVCIVTALHAVTVTWTVPNSQYEWLTKTNGGSRIDISSVGIYFVYTSTQLTSETVGTIAPTTNGSRPTFSGASGVTMSTSAAFANEANDDGKFGARASFSKLSGDAVAGKGYFYMVVFSKSEEANLYMVAGGSQYVVDKTTGIYDSTVSGRDVPTGADYVDNIAIIGGTWTAAKTPEPTTLALLAFGMAGLALRRRVRW